GAAMPVPRPSSPTRVIRPPSTSTSPATSLPSTSAASTPSLTVAAAPGTAAGTARSRRRTPTPTRAAGRSCSSRARTAPPRREEQPFAAGWPLCRLVDERPERRVRGDYVAQPLQRSRRGEHDAHRVPRPRHRVAEDVHAGLGVRLEPFEHAEDHSRRAEYDRH